MSLSRHRDGRARTSKHTRMVRRVNADLRRQVKRMAISGRGAYVTLLAVLAQQGGEVTVTKGTIDQVNENFKHLSFEVGQPTPNEYVVKLMVGEEEGEPVSEDTLGTEDAVVEDTHNG